MTAHPLTRAAAPDIAATPRTVAVDFASNWEIRGGVWRYGIELTRALVRLLGSGHVVVPVYDRLPQSFLDELRGTEAKVSPSTLASRYDRLDAMTRKNGRVVPWKSVLPLIYRPALRQQLFRSGLDGAEVYHALFACRGRPRRGVTVGTIHDLIPWLNYPDSPKNKAWMQGLIAGHREWAELVITPSAATRDALVGHGGFPADRVRVVHHGIDQDHFSPDASVDQALLERHGVQAGRFLLYVSSLAPHKNVDRMARAYLDAVGARRDMPLLLSGSVEHLTPALRAILDDGTGRVRHIGYLADHELPTFYRSARALVHVALAEGFGFTPLEAMACGCPVVVSRDGASGEVVGDAGVRVDPLNVEDIARGISRILTDDALATSLRERGPRHCRQFTWDRCARQTVAVYDEAWQRGIGAA
jgi:glycosyltransferase involved in cell wall biosynthesis